MTFTFLDIHMSFNPIGGVADLAAVSLPPDRARKAYDVVAQHAGLRIIQYGSPLARD
jgi:hypothetical protein